MPRPTLDHYLSLNYPITLIPDEDGYFAEVRDLPGCMTQGDTAEEALAMIGEAKEAWIRAAYANRDEIPLPSDDDRFSGRLLVRMPRGLHRALSEQARDQGVSLNQWVVALLSEANPLRALQRQVNDLSRQVFRLSSVANSSMVVPPSQPQVRQFATGGEAMRTDRERGWRSSEPITRIARIKS